jgi:hypothetical protein
MIMYLYDPRFSRTKRFPPRASDRGIAAIQDVSAPPTLHPRCNSLLLKVPGAYEQFEEAVRKWIATCVVSRTKIRGVPVRAERKLVNGNPSLLDIWNKILRFHVGREATIQGEYGWKNGGVASIRFTTTAAPPPPPKPAPPPPKPAPPLVTRSIAQWRELADQKFIHYRRQIPGRLTDVDAKELNRRITASYAKMYLSRPSVFKWAGMAALASAEVGHGMQQAWQLGFGDWGTSAGATALIWVGGLVKTGKSVGPMLGKKLFWALTGGNRFVWWDIFWQHLAYQEQGIAALVAAHKAGELPLANLQAWQRIDAGNQKSDAAQIWQGNSALLRYEQEFVLQVQVYDRSQDLWPVISDDVPSPIPGHGVKFTRYVPGGNIGDLRQRWKWIEESMLPAWKSLETNEPAKVRSLLLALT